MFSNLLSAILNSEIMPNTSGIGVALSNIGNWLLEAVGWILQMVGNGLYWVARFALNLIDFMQFLVQKLAGLEVWMNMDDLDLGNLEETDVVFRFLLSDTVIDVFKTMFTIFLVLLIVFCIFAIIKNEYSHATGSDMKDHKKVWYSAAKAFMTVILVPIFLITGIIASNAILASIAKAFNVNGNLSLGGQIFVASAYDANSFRYYANTGVRKYTSNTVNFELDGEKYTVNSAIEPISSDELVYGETFGGFMFTHDGKTFYLWRCSASEAKAYYYYLKYVLGAAIVESNAGLDENIVVPETINTNFAGDDVRSKAEEMYHNYVSGYVNGSSSSVAGYFEAVLEMLQPASPIVRAAYNTWTYNAMLETSVSNWGSQSLTLDISTDTFTTLMGATREAQVVKNHSTWAKLHDGGVNGFAPLAVEYKVMADVVEYMLENNLSLYFVNSNNLNIDYQAGGINENTMYDCASSDTPDGKPNGFLVDYADVGRVAYEIKQGVKSEVDGAVYIVCYYDNESNMYVPLVNNKKAFDAKGNQYNMFTSGQYSFDYTGPVIARAMFKETTKARICEPTYITTTMIVDGLGADFDSKLATAVKLDYLSDNLVYTYLHKLTDESKDNVSFGSNFVDKNYVISNDLITYYAASNTIDAAIANDIADTIVKNISGYSLAGSVTLSAGGDSITFNIESDIAQSPKQHHCVTLTKRGDVLKIVDVNGNDLYRFGFEIDIKTVNGVAPKIETTAAALDMTIDRNFVLKKDGETLKFTLKVEDYFDYDNLFDGSNWDNRNAGFVVEKTLAVLALYGYESITTIDFDNFDANLYKTATNVLTIDVKDGDLNYYKVNFGFNNDPATVNSVVSHTIDVSMQKQVNVPYVELEGSKVYVAVDGDYLKVAEESKTVVESLDAALGYGVSAEEYLQQNGVNVLSTAYTIQEESKLSAQSLPTVDSNGASNIAIKQTSAEIHIKNDEIVLYFMEDNLSDEDKLELGNSNYNHVVYTIKQMLDKKGFVVVVGSEKGKDTAEYSFYVYDKENGENSKQFEIKLNFDVEDKDSADNYYEYHIGLAIENAYNENPRVGSGTDIVYDTTVGNVYNRDELFSYIGTNTSFDTSNIRKTLEGDSANPDDKGLSDKIAEMVKDSKNNISAAVWGAVSYEGGVELAPQSAGNLEIRFNVKVTTDDKGTANDDKDDTYYLVEFILKIKEFEKVSDDPSIYRYIFTYSYSIYNTFSMHGYTEEDTTEEILVKDGAENDSPAKVVTILDLNRQTATQRYDLGNEKYQTVVQYKYVDAAALGNVSYTFNAVVTGKSADNGIEFITAKYDKDSTPTFAANNIEFLGEGDDDVDENLLLFAQGELRVIYLPEFSYVDSETNTAFIIDTENTNHKCTIYYSATLIANGIDESSVIVGIAKGEEWKEDSDYVTVSKDYATNYIKERIVVKNMYVGMHAYQNLKVTTVSGSATRYTATLTTNTGEIISVVSTGALNGEEDDWDENQKNANRASNMNKYLLTASINYTDYRKFGEVKSITTDLAKFLDRPASVAFCRDEMGSGWVWDFKVHIWSETEGFEFLWRGPKFGFANIQKNADLSDNEVLVLDGCMASIDYTFSGNVLLGNVYLVTNINWLILVIAIFIIFGILGKAVWGLISRIYQITLLFLIMPAVASTLPIDEKGDRFKKWKDKLISQVLGAYGVTIGLNFFFIIVPVIREASAIFTDADIANMSAGMRFWAGSADRLNYLCYVLFLLVAFTLLKTVPSLVQEFTGFKDGEVISQGEKTKGNVVKTLEETGKSMSGTNLVGAVKKGQSLVKGAIPGKAIYDEYTNWKDKKEKKKAAKKGHADEERLEENKQLGAKHAAESMEALQQKMATKAQEVANAQNTSQNGSAQSSGAGATTDVAKVAEGLTDAAKQEIINEAKNETKEYTEMAMEATKIAMEGAAVTTGVGLHDYVGDREKAEADAKAEEEARKAQEKADKKAEKQYERSREGRAEADLEYAEKMLEINSKKAELGKGKKSILLTNDDIDAYNERHKGDANFKKLAKIGEEGFASFEQQSLRKAARQEKYLSKLERKVEKRADIYDDAKRGVYRGIRGGLSRAWDGEKTTAQKDKDSAKFNKAVQELKGASDDRKQVKDILNSFDKNAVGSRYEAEKILEQLGKTKAGKNAIGNYEVLKSTMMAQGMRAEDAWRASFASVVDNAEKKADKNFANKEKALDKARANVIDTHKGFAHKVLKPAGATVSNKVAALGVWGKTNVVDPTKAVVKDATDAVKQVLVDKEEGMRLRNTRKGLKQLLGDMDGISAVVDANAKSKGRKLTDDERASLEYSQLAGHKHLGKRAQKIYAGKLQEAMKDGRTLTSEDQTKLYKETNKEVRAQMQKRYDRLEKFADVRGAVAGGVIKFGKGVSGFAKGIARGTAGLYTAISDGAKARFTRKGVRNQIEQVSSMQGDINSENFKNSEKAFNALMNNKLFGKRAKKIFDENYEKAMKGRTKDLSDAEKMQLFRSSSRQLQKELERKYNVMNFASEKAQNYRDAKQYRRVSHETVDKLTRQQKLKNENRRIDDDSMRDTLTSRSVGRADKAVIEKLEKKLAPGAGGISDKNKEELRRLLAKYKDGMNFSESEKKRFDYYMKAHASTASIKAGAAVKSQLKASKNNADLSKKLNDAGKRNSDKVAATEALAKKTYEQVIKDLEVTGLPKTSLDKLASQLKHKTAAQIEKDVKKEVEKILKDKQELWKKASGEEQNALRRQIKELQNTMAVLKRTDMKYKRDMKQIKDTNRKLSKQVKNQKSSNALSESIRSAQNNPFNKK